MKIRPVTILLCCYPIADMEPRKHQPFVPNHIQMTEFTWRAVISASCSA
jgi:hypothetical protein